MSGAVPTADLGRSPQHAKPRTKRLRADDDTASTTTTTTTHSALSSSSSSSSSHTVSHTSKQHKASHPPSDDSFLRTFSLTNRFRLGYPSHMTLTPDGETLLFLRAASATSFTHDLYALDLGTRVESCLLSAASLLPHGAEEQLSVEEKAMRERMRLSGKGLQSFLLSPADANLLLLPFAGQLHLFDRRTSATTQLTHSSSSPLSPQWSPDGSMVSFVRDSDIHIIDIASSTSWQLTFIPSPAVSSSTSTSSTSAPAAASTVTNGMPDFIAAEEMNRFSGHWWSPDSLHVVYQQTDTAGMEMFSIADPSSPSSPPVSFPYPRAGKRNASVKVGIIAVDKTKRVGRRSRTTSNASSSISSPMVLSTPTSPSHNHSAPSAAAAVSPSPSSPLSAASAAPGAVLFTPLPPITIDDSDGGEDSGLHVTSLTDQRTGKIVFSPSSHSKRFAYKDRHVVDSTIWCQWDRAAFPYLVAVSWSDLLSPLTLVVQSRDQRTVLLLRCETITGNTEELLREYNEHWVSVDQSCLESLWIAGGKGFVWSTERSGCWTVELYDRKGTWLRRVVEADIGYRSVAHVDGRKDCLYVHASRDPTQQHLVRVPLGLRETEGAAAGVQLLTTTAGMHKAVIKHSSSSRFIHQLNTVAGKPSIAVRELRGSVEDGWKVEVSDVAAALPFASRVVIDTVTVPTTPLPLYTAVIPPSALSAAAGGYVAAAAGTERRWPVIVYCYGGPHYQTVTHDYHSFLLSHFLASHGFFVVTIDGRGTPFRTAAFERSLKGKLATTPLEDQAAALSALLARHSAMDPQRVGVWGWSFGGLMAAMCAALRPDLYCAAIAGAPVTRWADYDSHYTERYLDLPRERDGDGEQAEREEAEGGEADAYAASSPLTWASRVRVPLLLVHGTADDNVYLSHSLLLSAALLRAAVEHDFLPLVNCTHMVADPLINQRLYERLLAFFTRHVRDRPHSHHHHHQHHHDESMQTDV